LKYLNKHTLKKEALTLGFLFLFFSVSAQQERFNVRFDSGFPNTLLMSVIEVEDGYVSTGFLGDSISNARPMIFAKFDYEGNLLFQEVHGSGGTDYFSSQSPDLNFLNDTTLMHSGITYDSEGVRQGYIAQFNLDGDSLQVFRYYSPNADPEFTFFSALRVIKSANDNLLFLAGFVQENTGNDILIWKLQQNGDIAWQYVYATEQIYDYCRVIIPTDDGGVIAIAKIGLLGEEPDFHHVFKLDADGELDWEFESEANHLTGAVSDGILVDNHFVLATSVPNEQYTGTGGIPAVMKMDMEGEQLWVTPIWENQYHYNHGVRKVLLAEDGNYVAAGWRYEILDEPNDTSGTFNDLAWISKLNSETGEILWTRYYQYLDLPFEKHRLYDMRNTSDGGFIFCGQSLDLWPGAELTDPPYQQGWLVKLDEYGCLVEGCEEFDIAVEESRPQQVQFFKAGPNPASEVLHIYQTQQLDKNATYTITDLHGKVIQQFTAPQANTTLILNVDSWTSGTYALSLSENNKLLQSEKIVVR